jgi:DNA polymerase II small subunit/DNA polymerase delta subunit B
MEGTKDDKRNALCQPHVRKLVTKVVTNRYLHFYDGVSAVPRRQHSQRSDVIKVYRVSGVHICLAFLGGRWKTIICTVIITGEVRAGWGKKRDTNP